MIAVVAPQGFEPRVDESESSVLPLNEGAIAGDGAALRVRKHGLADCQFESIGWDGRGQTGERVVSDGLGEMFAEEHCALRGTGRPGVEFGEAELAVEEVGGLHGGGLGIEDGDAEAAVPGVVEGGEDELFGDAVAAMAKKDEEALELAEGRAGGGGIWIGGIGGRGIGGRGRSGGFGGERWGGRGCGTEGDAACGFAIDGGEQKGTVGGGVGVGKVEDLPVEAFEVEGVAGGDGAEESGVGAKEGSCGFEGLESLGGRTR